MYFHLYRLVAVTETARYVRVVILKFKIKVNFDSLMGENSGGKTGPDVFTSSSLYFLSSECWLGCPHLVFCLF